MSDDSLNTKFKDYTNIKVGRLLILDYHHDFFKNGEHGWLCLCDCGNYKMIAVGSLRPNGTKSCGCLQKEENKARLVRNRINRKERTKEEKYTLAISSLYSVCKGRATRSKLEFTLTKTIFEKLILQNCFYCGSVPSNYSGYRYEKALIHYSGIDRVDNSMGYIEKNTVPCCKKCNIAKRHYSKDEFKTWIIDVYNHLELTKWQPQI